MTSDRRSVVVHAHLYQPPREDPWLDEVPHETSAAPFHDWNERITHECYRPIVAARVLDGQGRIVRMHNALASISYDVGPTLLDWLEREDPHTYARILEADRESRSARGWGNAIASPYHHVILPLCSPRDRVTEVRWGIRDFERRFGRPPDGFWLPETAVDDATLEVLVSHGIRFTILAPHQVNGAPPDGSPGRYRTAAGPIAIFPYDGALSHDIAFGSLVRDAGEWERRTLAGAGRRLAVMATDGETYGHHHRFGDMALAAFVDRMERRADAVLTNPAAWLASHPMEHDLTLVAPSSWSCPHGVERWRADCGCRAHHETASSQAWRAPLRKAFDHLARDLHRRYASSLAAFGVDPWDARDDYAAVVTDRAMRSDFVARWFPRASEAEVTAALSLLEMERSVLRMFTSCGWFFDDIDGLETRQVVRYAAHALGEAGDEAHDLVVNLRATLTHAVSNDRCVGTAAEVYDEESRDPAVVPLIVAAADEVARTFGIDGARVRSPAYSLEREGVSAVIVHLATGRRTVAEVHLEAAEPEVTVRVEPHHGSARTFELGDFPDHVQREIAHARRALIARRWFTEREHGLLAAGHPIDQVVADTLAAGLRGLADDPDETPQRILDLAAYLTSLDTGLPFEVQAAYARIRTRLDPEVERQLSPRFGFA